MTEAEHRLWWRLRDRQLLGAKFRRQEPIGRYFADFCCVEHKLIIELDGGQHDEEPQQEYDLRRTAYLQRCGYRVLRFWNTEVLGELEGVLETIAEEIIGSPHPVPLPAGEGTLSRCVEDSRSDPGKPVLPLEGSLSPLEGPLSRRERDRVRGSNEPPTAAFEAAGGRLRRTPPRR